MENASLEKIMITSQKNPVIPGLGVCDPHIHPFGDKVFLFASHDADPNTTDYCMYDWQIWSSIDFIHWELETIVKPESFFMGKSSKCWAVDAAFKNDQYYFYYSNGNEQTGVAVGSKPEGPYREPYKRALLDGTLTTTKEYDPAVFVDEDGQAYILFGGPVWAYGLGAGYYIAKLKEDMISLAESPRLLPLNHEADDKVSLNKLNGTYYLTWGSFYAVSHTVYGPYSVLGNTGASADHGSYMEWKGQWFNAFTIFDPTMLYRATGICYVHQKANLELVVDQIIVEYGVGQYQASWNKIEAEWYMAMDNGRKVENLRWGFDVLFQKTGSLFFPNIHNIRPNTGMSFFVSCDCMEGGVIEIREKDKAGTLLGQCPIPYTKAMSWRSYRITTCQLSNSREVKDIYLEIRLYGSGSCRIDYFKFFEVR